MSGRVADDFISRIAPYIQYYAPQYGIKVVSPIIAQAILESQWGNSTKAVVGHNYFGLKWRNNRCAISNEYFIDSSSEQLADGSYTPIVTKWCKFKSMEDGVIGYFQWINTPTYKNLKGVTNPEEYLTNIKEDGYATSHNYVFNLVRVIQQYDLTQFDPKPEENNMGYEMKTNYALRGNYGGMRNVQDIKYIVIHYTANDGDTDEANAKYFKNNLVKSSAHYFVDDDSVTQSVPDDYVAWAVGGSRYNDYLQTGGAKYYGKCTNSNSISIELCDTVRDGRIYPSEATIGNAVALTRSLMSKYKISIANVIRHFDVTGKYCPAYWMDTTSWVQNFLSKLAKTDKVKPVPRLYRVQCGAFKYKVNALLLQAKLKSAGFSTFLTQVDELWKVQCGAFSKRENAEALKTQLLQLGFAAIVV